MLRNWLDFHRETRSVVSIGGKTIYGSKGRTHKAYHVVSAFVAENCITLWEIKTEEKANEITDMPELLDILDQKDAIASMDVYKAYRKAGAETYLTFVDGCVKVSADDAKNYTVVTQFDRENDFLK